MRYLVTFIIVFALAACNKAPDTRNTSPSGSQTQTLSSGPQKASLDSVVQFLLTSAATDFHTHRPPDPVRFRNVRVGHIVGPDGATRYMMCGQFLPAQGGDKAQWIPFATIKTSGYEQYIGATTYCQDTSAVWDDVGDLSSSLQRQLDSLR